ncbi:hypothetical protein HPB50_028430 [Hyalomma asiaticum]|nr:hypothetical protein HPB50_028430 [Hyalomma asiaticum]
MRIEDRFLRTRCDDLWERAAATLPCQKLSFFALLQDDYVGMAPPDDGALVQELRWRLQLAEKDCRRPASVIMFSCCDKSYDARAVASCFPDGPCPLPRPLPEVRDPRVATDAYLRVGVVRKARHRISVRMALVRRGSLGRERPHGVDGTE